MTIALLETANFGLQHLVDAAYVRGHQTILLTSDRSRYTHELSGAQHGCLDVVDADTTDVEAVTATLKAVPDLAGVVRNTDRWSLPALAVAERLGLPHQNRAAVELLRDKGRLRRHLYDRDFSRAPSVVLDPQAVVGDDVLRILPFPCIVKDATGSASENVWLAKNQAEITEVLAVARRSVPLQGRTLTVEPYFVGPMYSAETVSWGGETVVIGVSSRGMSSTPHFREESASFPVALPDKTRTELDEWIAQILASVGYRDGVTHTEFIVTKDGFEIVEINARLGGALIGETIRRSIGVDIHGALIDLALGQRPRLLDLEPTRRHGTAQIAIYAPAPGIFDRIEGIDLLTENPGSPRLYQLRGPGDVIAAVNDQRGVVAAVIADGETAELSLHNAMSAAGQLIVHLR